MVHVRLATPEDAPAIVAILREVAEERNSTPRQPHEAPTLEEHRAAIANADKEGTIWFVAEEHGAVIGFLSAKRGKRDAMKHVADLGLTVARHARGRGVGEVLMRALETWARGAGVRKLTLGAFHDNERALKLYRRLGYQVDGVRTGMFILDGRTIDEVLMSKWLD